MKRGGPLRRLTPLRSRTPLRARSKSKKARKAEAELRESRIIVWERSEGRCEARGFSPDCTGRGVHAHHKRLRSQGGGHAPEGLLWVCAACHEHIHHLPLAAEVAGLIVTGRKGAA